jgi:hypothetical protein
MNIKLKRKYKRLTKVFYIFAFVFIGLFFLNMILFITRAFGLDAREMNAVLVMVILFSPLFITMIFWFFAMMYYNTYMQHHYKVKEWRKRKLVSKIIEFETSDRHKEAVDLYGSLRNGMDRDYMYMFIVTNSMHSDDPERKEKAIGHFNKIKEWYNTETLTF